MGTQKMYDETKVQAIADALRDRYEIGDPNQTKYKISDMGDAVLGLPRVSDSADALLAGSIVTLNTRTENIVSYVYNNAESDKGSLNTVNFIGTKSVGAYAFAHCTNTYGKNGHLHQIHFDMSTYSSSDRLVLGKGCFYNATNDSVDYRRKLLNITYTYNGITYSFGGTADININPETYEPFTARKLVNTNSETSAPAYMTTAYTTDNKPHDGDVFCSADDHKPYIWLNNGWHIYIPPVKVLMKGFCFANTYIDWMPWIVELDYDSGATEDGIMEEINGAGVGALNPDPLPFVIFTPPTFHDVYRKWWEYLFPEHIRTVTSRDNFPDYELTDSKSNSITPFGNILYENTKSYDPIASLSLGSTNCWANVSSNPYFLTEDGTDLTSHYNVHWIAHSNNACNVRTTSSGGYTTTTVTDSGGSWGSYQVFRWKKVKTLSLPNLKILYKRSIFDCSDCTALNLPNVEYLGLNAIGTGTNGGTHTLNVSISIPGNYSMTGMSSLKEFHLPKLNHIHIPGTGDCAMTLDALEELYLGEGYAGDNTGVVFESTCSPLINHCRIWKLVLAYNTMFQWPLITAGSNNSAMFQSPNNDDRETLLKFIGETTTAITTGSSIKNIEVSGVTYTLTSSNRVITTYGGKDWYFNGSKWSEWGTDGNKHPVILVPQALLEDYRTARWTTFGYTSSSISYCVNPFPPELFQPIERS